MNTTVFVTFWLVVLARITEVTLDTIRTAGIVQGFSRPSRASVERGIPKSATGTMAPRSIRTYGVSCKKPARLDREQNIAS